MREEVLLACTHSHTCPGHQRLCRSRVLIHRAGLSVCSPAGQACPLIDVSQCSMSVVLHHSYTIEYQTIT